MFLISSQPSDFPLTFLRAQRKLLGFTGDPMGDKWGNFCSVQVEVFPQGAQD